MVLSNDIITIFQILYQKIFDIYNQNIEPTQKWDEIAKIINDEQSNLFKIFKAIKKEKMKKEIDLDYLSSQKLLWDKIESESNLLVKSSLIISSLHHIIYDLLSKEGNYLFSLNGKQEMSVLKKNIIYYISVSNKPEKNIYFHAFIIIYALESIFNRHFYVGIDFEYTNKKIQLAQFNFEHNVSLSSFIMIINPNDLTPDMIQNYINLIICNRYIDKIIHGGDSLDIPYIYNILLQDDPKKIIKFTKSLIDTRYLCEYYKINRDPNNYKCAIYDIDKNDSAVYYFGVVNEEQQHKLTELMESLPHPSEIRWRIFSMPQSQTLYAQYDVIFLKWFYYKIINVATQDEPTDLGKKSIIELYKHILGELTQFLYLEKKGITFLVEKAKLEVDPVNNYMIRKPGTILKMIDVFNQVSTNIVTASPRVEIDKIVKVNYYKGSIITLIKKMTYTIISKKCRVYKDKNTVWVDKLDNSYIDDFFNKIGFTYLEKIFRDIEVILEMRIRNICN